MNNNQDDKKYLELAKSQLENNVDQDLGIKLVIPEYDGKLKPDELMDWSLSVKNIFAHKPMTEGHKVTMVATRFCNYVAIWQYGRLRYNRKGEGKL